MTVNLDEFETIFKKLYGSDAPELSRQYNRYRLLIDRYLQRFAEKDIHFFSVPGRTELGGNHTDHNHGKVLAASVNLDAIAAASKNRSQKIVIYSQGYEHPFEVNLSELNRAEGEAGTTTALIRGIAARYTDLGFAVGGFNAHISSDVLPGSGLSSSASVEVLIGTILNYLFNDGKITAETIAQTGQYAENKFFGKPCGLMDQMTCALGGVLSMDFENPQNPAVKKINFDFEESGYGLLIVNTGGSHADLTAEYASVSAEMKFAAKIFGAQVLREVSMEDYLSKIPDIRKQAGDRAVLRGLHFFQENKRVELQEAALQSGNMTQFLELVKESGNSSFKWLQNIYSSKNAREQSLALALALTEKYISEIGAGACRVHGGGFAGAIQVFLPGNAIEKYSALMEPLFCKKSVRHLKLRPIGAIQLY